MVGADLVAANSAPPPPALTDAAAAAASCAAPGCVASLGQMPGGGTAPSAPPGGGGGRRLRGTAALRRRYGLDPPGARTTARTASAAASATASATAAAALEPREAAAALGRPRMARDALGRLDRLGERHDGDDDDDERDGEEDEEEDEEDEYGDANDQRLDYDSPYGLDVQGASVASHHHHHRHDLHPPHLLLHHHTPIDDPGAVALGGDLNDVPGVSGVSAEMHSELMEAVMQQWLQTPAGQAAASEAARLGLSTEEVGQFFHARMLQSLGRLRMGGAADAASAEQMRVDVGTLTGDDEAAVQRLVGLGFPREQAAEAYLACERNEMLAANFLMDHQ